jgi:hypothetical protein|tara:strand:- start:850 stop:1020 length:171 start_codon:yes stop_codon:yes gene_type:complete
MNITNAKYVKTKEGKNISINATINGEELSIPLFAGNRHYDAILEWVAKGNTVEEAD